MCVCGCVFSLLEGQGDRHAELQTDGRKGERQTRID